MYIAYKNALEELLINISMIKTIDWYNRQYARYEELKAINFPAVYIEFPEPMVWQTLGEGIQQATTEIRLHLVAFDIADSPNPTLELSTLLHQAIHGKRLMDGNEQLSTELVRIHSELVTEYDQLKVVIIGYKATFSDCSTMNQFTVVPNVSLFVIPT